MNWEKRLEPKKFDWSDGACLVGVLLNYERRMMTDQKTRQTKAVVRYTVREVEDINSLAYVAQPWFFYGTYVLDSALRITDVGHFVSITCKGEDKSAGRNGNPMKLFDVNVSKEVAPGFALDGTEITDDDLPPAESYN